jgi:Phage small terminase subunit
MTSPARKHFERISAASSQAAEADTPRDANGYELMLYKLAQDKRRLKDVQSVERKAEVKRELLPEYAPWIDGVLAGNQGVQDDVLMTVMVWRIDIGDLDAALVIARYAVEHKLLMPDQFKRTTACLIAEEVADVALKALDGGTVILATPLHTALSITADEDMPDEVRAKLHKAIGLTLAATHKPDALEHLRRAFGLHDKAGVKKDIEKLERELKNLAAVSTSSQQSANPATGGEV